MRQVSLRKFLCDFMRQVHSALLYSSLWKRLLSCRQPIALRLFTVVPAAFRELLRSGR